MKNVYGYIRVSTKKQGEGVSLEVQKEAIEAYATKHQLHIIQWFEELETAAKQGRPLFTTMMKLLNNRKAEGVILHKIDRGARNLKDWADIGTLFDNGIEVHFAHESLNMAERGGRLSADIQAIMAADYIRNLQQESKKGLDGRLKQGIWPFTAPIGYLNNGGGKYKTIDPVQGPLVRKAFELYATRRYSLKTLALYMSRLGMRKGKVAVTQLSEMLNNPFYIGILKARAGTFPGGHEPLIAPALFKRVKTILQNKTNHKTIRHDYLYKKLLTCKDCSYMLTAEVQKGHVYYRCHTKNCPSKTIRESAISTLLKSELSKVELFPIETASLEEMLHDIEMGWGEKQNTLMQSIKLQKAQIAEKLERLTDCYIEGGIDKETFEQRKAKLVFETTEKEAALTELEKGKENIFRRTRKFFELLKSLTNQYEIANPEKKRKLIEIITSNLTVQSKNVEITMRSPFFEMLQSDNIRQCCLSRNQLRIPHTKHASTNKSLPECCLSRNEVRNPHTKHVDTDNNLSALARPIYSREQLKELLQLIITTVAQLPDNDIDDYAL